MEGDLQVLSREIVKPSSRTPEHLKRLKFSYFDQLVTPHYVPVVMFYQSKLASSTTTQISQQMKQSLSDTLTSFYPLAGRVDDLAIDCNDAGVEFITARTHAHLSDVIKDPDLEDLKKYIPIDPAGPGVRPVFNVQISFFDCGGIALGVYYSHIVTDCHSLLMFLNAWASTCRGETKIPQSARFDLANYFPAREFSSPIFFGREAMSKEKLEKCSVKRFVFSKKMIAHLKENIVTSPRSQVKDPTRVELVSAFIWRHFLEAARIRHPSSPKTYAALHAVNLRGRKSLSHSLETTFGNCAIKTFAFADTTKASVNFHVEEFHELVTKMRSSIRRIDDDYITELQIGNNYVNDLYKLLSLYANGELEWCNFSSWCRFPVYDVDFGFGRPIWYCTTSLPMTNTVVLTSNRSGDSIEAWVNTEEDSLKILEAKINLISSGSTDHLLHLL